MGKFIRRILNDTKSRLFLIAFSAPKHTKPVEETGGITHRTAAWAGHWHGVNGGVVFEVEGLEDVTAVGATE